jgi:hypothetical protein
MRAVALVALLLLAGCDAAEERRAGDGGTRIAGHGLEVTLPEGWRGDVTKLGPGHAATLRAATFRLGPLTDIGRAAQETMSADDLLLVVVDYGVVPGQGEAAALPLRLRTSDVVDFEGFLGPVATTSAVVAGSTLQVWVVAAAAPTGAQLARANAVLATLRVERAEDVPFVDDEVGVSGRYPQGWHRARSLTGFTEPREVLALASYPLRGGARAGECAPDTARADMPAGGAFIWLLEYREELPRSRFPDRSTLRLRRDELGEDVACFAGPGRSTTFGADERRFQLLVAFGGPPDETRLREVSSILDSLAFERR